MQSRGVIAAVLFLLQARALHVPTTTTPKATTKATRRQVLHEGLFLPGLGGLLCVSSLISRPCHAVAPNTDEASPRPLLYRVENTYPMTLQPFIQRAVGLEEQKIVDISDVVLLGAGRGDADDVVAAANIAKDLAFFAQRSKRKVILALDAAPLGTPLPSTGVPQDVETWPGARGDGAWLDAIWEVPCEERVAVGVGGETLRRLQQEGLNKGLTANETRLYLGGDDGGERFVTFARETTGFDMYVERVVARRYDQLGLANVTGAPTKNNYISASLFQHEATAVALADLLKENPDALVLAVVGEDAVKFGHGIQGRLERISTTTKKSRRGGGKKDAAAGTAATSILCNPSAKSTYSLNTRLRMSLTAQLEFEPRRVADFIFFSASPPPNLLERMMNPLDALPHIDFGLSTGGDAAI